MKYTLISLTILLVGASVYSQNINTFAGNGIIGYSGDGGPATSARVHGPFGVTHDNNGNLYIASHGNACIRKVNSSGIISTIAGTNIGGYSGDGGPATLAQLQLPSCVAIDAAGNLYIADTGNQSIRKINSSGVITTIVGTGAPGFVGDGGPATSALLNYPYGVAVDALGNIYIADAYNNRIRKVNSAGIISTIAGDGSPGNSGDGGLANLSQIHQPNGISVDGAGNLYVSAIGGIRKINTSNIITTVSGSTLTQPRGAPLIVGNDIYVASSASNKVEKINQLGVVTTIAGTGTGNYNGDNILATTAWLFNPSSVAIDSAGVIYIADYLNYRVRAICPSTVNCSVGLEEHQLANQVSISPNPSNSQFSFAGLIGDNTIQITDITGRVLMTEKTSSENHSINLNASQGMYFYKISDKQNRVQQGKLIIQ